MKVACLYLAFNLLILASSFASAYDPSLLQDFCVAVNDTNNGGLNIPKSTSNSVGSVVTPVNIDQIPGLNTLSISLVRIDYAPNGGLNPPHTHPRGTKILVVLEGILYVGFVTSTIANTVFGSNLPVNLDVLTTAFQLSKKIVKYLQSRF
ncbi:hypothetical protein Goklo_021221 [Gossypium klotzschianum]|uniref:Cupin type-1 domain-containing protein n=1 Tax=Gossypium klotzschianum TaxID=34286 RepID=A0A7J8UUH5_9ROSI|nr:hypothetical protein [Gossypium klotzschianum]